MALEISVVDSFTDRPFSGNPAAVAFIERFPSDEAMQAIASELNLSDTAFVVARPDGDFDMRWFTPKTEVDLCGHATLAATHLLGKRSQFHTRSGVLTCDIRDGLIEMNFPALPPQERPVPLGLDMPGMCWYGIGGSDALVELIDAEVLRSLDPDLGMVSALGTRTLIVTAKGDRSGIDFICRVFGPNAGIPEDPVTGSAYCILACYWGDRLGFESLHAEQASDRGGNVRTTRQEDRVIIGGKAVTMAQVQLHEWGTGPSSG
jgi:predicted PhzF superfamily epimerase YddE/YHI9